jgi:hypothetical protein
MQTSHIARALASGLILSSAVTKGTPGRSTVLRLQLLLHVRGSGGIILAVALRRHLEGHPLTGESI